jgi:hypothetical protein
VLAELLFRSRVSQTSIGRPEPALFNHDISTWTLSPAEALGAVAEADRVTRRWTQEEIAAHLGTVRDMVGRTLRAFADAGLVRMERQCIMLLDREGLEAEAQR